MVSHFTLIVLPSIILASAATKCFNCLQFDWIMCDIWTKRARFFSDTTNTKTNECRLMMQRDPAVLYVTKVSGKQLIDWATEKGFTSKSAH